MTRSTFKGTLPSNLYNLCNTLLNELWVQGGNPSIINIFLGVPQLETAGWSGTFYCFCIFQVKNKTFLD